MSQINITPQFNKKQSQAFKCLLNEYDTDIVYGGGAGSGKSYIGCAWLIVSCIRYPGTRWLMGRSKLKALEETTLVTFFDVASSWGLESEVHYKYNSKKNVIVFGKDYGGSVILLKDLFAYPSDPEFDSLGSLEITGAFLDEAAQITAKAKEIVRSRIRYRLDNFCHKCSAQRTNEQLEDVYVDGIPKKKWVCSSCKTETFGLAPKILMTCNPSKGWLYTNFYKPWRDGRLDKGKQFIHALVGDNPFIQSSYVENLQGLTGTNRERLLEGSWEYDEQTYSLIDYSSIVDVFNNRVSGGERIITADIARQGRDKTVICFWNGLRAEKFFTLDKNTVPQAAELIREVQRKYLVHSHNIYIDEDGIGGGVKDMLDENVNGIVNNSPPIFIDGERENFGNLKSQLYWYLADYINNKKIWIVSDENKETIMQELEWARRKNADHDAKFYVIPKQEIREQIGRSPDFLDVLAFRIYHELNDGALFL